MEECSLKEWGPTTPPTGKQKSTLHPVQKIFFLGNWLDLEAREIRSHPRAFLQMFHAWVRVACKPRPNSRLLPKVLGFLQWHVCSRAGSGSFLAGAYYHDRWGNSKLPTPVKVLHSLITIMTRCVEPWRPPSHSKFSVARGMFVEEMTDPDFFGLSIFVDAAWDRFGYRVWGGGGVPRRGVRSWAVQSRVLNQQEAELRGVVWAIRLACRFGWRAVTIFTDSTAAGY